MDVLREEDYLLDIARSNKKRHSRGFEGDGRVLTDNAKGDIALKAAH